MRRKVRGRITRAARRLSLGALTALATLTAGEGHAHVYVDGEKIAVSTGRTPISVGSPPVSTSYG